MQRMELKPVSDEIITLDQHVNNQDKAIGINSKICKGDAYHHASIASAGTEGDGKCGIGVTSLNGKTGDKGLDKLWQKSHASSHGGGNYEGERAGGAVGEKTSAKISKDISELTSAEKGLVSSAFAKAHEGAEISSSSRKKQQPSKTCAHDIAAPLPWPNTDNSKNTTFHVYSY